MQNSLLFSRFLYAFLALFFCVSSASARDYSIQIHKIESQARINSKLEIPYLAKNQEVDLLETEIGCVGMSLDAIMLAASIEDACVTCPAYLANKTIMIFLKTVNRVSKAAGGYLTKGLLALFEKFRTGAISAAEFIARLGELGFLKNIDEAGGKALLEKTDNVIGKIIQACSIVPKLRTRETRATVDECDPAEALSVFNKAGQRVKTENIVSEQEFLNTVDEVSGIPGLRRSDPANPRGGGPLDKIANGNVSEDGFRGAYGEMEHAATLKRGNAASDIEFKGQVAGSRGNAEVDVSWKDANGNTYFDDVKESIGSGIGQSKKDQARRLCSAAKALNAIGRWVISSIPFDLDSIEKIEKLGIAVVDSNGNRIDTTRISDAELQNLAQRCP